VGRWNRDAILERAGKLATWAATVWPAPALPSDVLGSYRAKPAAAAYTIDDHPHLATGPMKSVFEEFRKQVLALDPCITEEFLKLYVAYKAETNFVDVIPQARRLRLVLNLKFPEINNPRGLCRDVTGLGRWGNGDVDVGLSTLDDLPYVLGLVRQANEKQMGPDTNA
jgi:predicted transport protein